MKQISLQNPVQSYQDKNLKLETPKVNLQEIGDLVNSIRQMKEQKSVITSQNNQHDFVENQNSHNKQYSLRDDKKKKYQFRAASFDQNFNKQFSMESSVDFQNSNQDYQQTQNQVSQLKYLQDHLKKVEQIRQNNNKTIDPIERHIYISKKRQGEEYDFSEIFHNGSSTKHIKSMNNKFNMSWKMIQSNGFQQQKEFRKKGKQQMEEMMSQRETNIQTNQENDLNSAINDQYDSFTQGTFSKQNTIIDTSLNATLYIQKMVEAKGQDFKNVSKQNNSRNDTKNHFSDKNNRFKSLALPELNTRHHLNVKQIAQSKNDYSLINQSALPNVLKNKQNTPILNNLDSQLKNSNKNQYSSKNLSSRNDSVTKLIQNGYLHALSIKNQLIVDTNRDNSQIEKSFNQQFKQIDDQERVHRRFKEKNNQSNEVPQSSINQIDSKLNIAKNRVLYQDIYQGKDIEDEDWEKALQDELLDQVDLSILKAQPNYDVNNKIFGSIKQTSQSSQNQNGPSMFKGSTDVMNDLTYGLKVHQIPKLTGGPLDKQKLQISQVDIAGAYKEESKRQQAALNDSTENHHLAQQMQNNEYFKKFAQKHQRKLESQIDRIYGKNSQSPEAIKKYIPIDFKEQFMSFLGTHNEYRMNNPHVFDAASTAKNKDFIRDKLRFLTPIKTRNEGSDIEDMLQNELSLRRLKAANYGKWYLKPDQYNKKIDKLNKKIDVYFKKEQ